MHSKGSKESPWKRNPIILPEEVCYRDPLRHPHSRSTSTLSLCDVFSHYRAPDSWIENCFWCWVFWNSLGTVLAFSPSLCISSFPFSALHLYTYNYNRIFFHTYHVSDSLLGTTQAFFWYSHLASHIIILTSEGRFRDLRESSQCHRTARGRGMMLRPPCFQSLAWDPRLSNPFRLPAYPALDQKRTRRWRLSWDRSVFYRVSF